MEPGDQGGLCLVQLLNSTFQTPIISSFTSVFKQTVPNKINHPTPNKKEPIFTFSTPLGTLQLHQDLELQIEDFHRNQRLRGLQTRQRIAGAWASTAEELRRIFSWYNWRWALKRSRVSRLVGSWGGWMLGLGGNVGSGLGCCRKCKGEDLREVGWVEVVHWGSGLAWSQLKFQ